jgi:hypothetical protein
MCVINGFDGRHMYKLGKVSVFVIVFILFVLFIFAKALLFMQRFDITLLTFTIEEVFETRTVEFAVGIARTPSLIHVSFFGIVWEARDVNDPRRNQVYE